MPTRGEEVQQKHQKVVQYMDNHGLDGVILSLRHNFAWYTVGGMNYVARNYTHGVASLFITRKGTTCMTTVIEGPRMKTEEFADLDIEVWSSPWYDPQQMAEDWAKTIGDRKVACDVRVGGLPDSVGTLESDFNRIRLELTETEIERVRQLGKDTGECLEEACRRTKPGETEHELAARLSGMLWERGARTPVLLMAADDRIEHYRHPIPTSRKFENYGMGVVCSERDGLWVSATRLFSFKPISDELADKHKAVCNVDAAMIAASRPGKTLEDVFYICKEAYKENGYPDQWKFHHQGGSSGYQPREFKGMPGVDVPIKENHSIAWNPSITGTKSEDTVLVLREGNELVSATGNWPTSPYEAGGTIWQRPDILII
jgi:Xaa-Pro aminopeptidase